MLLVIIDLSLVLVVMLQQIHGDLHPGNILVSRNDKGQLMMTMLDCGLVIEFGPRQHETVVKILGAFTRRQGREAGQLMVDTTSKCQADEMDVKLFIKGIEQIIVEDAEQVSFSRSYNAVTIQTSIVFVCHAAILCIFFCCSSSTC